MKIINPVIKVKKIATDQSVRIVEKTIEKTIEAGNFLTNIADAFLFVTKVTKETFSRNFEFKEFLRQCFQIGNKTLPLISVTGTHYWPGAHYSDAACSFELRGCQPASRNGSCISHQRNGAGYYCFDLCR